MVLALVLMTAWRKLRAGSMKDSSSMPPDAAKLAYYELPPVLVRDAFDRAGVIPGFSQVDPDQLYSLLLELPEREGEQKRGVGLDRFTAEFSITLMRAM